jgi:alcohol dehydrogenase class IV
MQPFTFHAPTRITFGADTASSAGEFVKELGGTRTLIVTDANLMKAGLLDKILSSFKDDGHFEPVIFSDVPADSDVPCVKQAAQLAIESRCDSLLAVGGGSVIDTAKVVNICLTYGGDLLDYQGLNNLPSRLHPLLCIPTTAGTGSEVSLVAMIKDHAEGKKLLFGSRLLAPDSAILDPALLLSLPPRLTAGTGLDALTHCLEALAAVSTSSSLTDSLSIEAMKMIFANLERATTDGANLEARSNMLVASTMAGLAFTNAGVGIVHAMAHATGGRYGTHHGITNAVFLPYGLDFNRMAIAPKYAYAARQLGITNSTDDAKGADELIRVVVSLIERCGLPSCLKDLGVPEFSEVDLEELAEQAITDPAIMFNPREASAEDIINIYKRAY